MFITEKLKAPANPSVSEHRRNSGRAKIKLLPGGVGFSSSRHIPALPWFCCLPLSCSGSKHPGSDTDPWLLRGKKGHSKFVPSLLNGSSWHGGCPGVVAGLCWPHPAGSPEELRDGSSSTSEGLDRAGQGDGNPPESRARQSRACLNARAHSREHPAQQAPGLCWSCEDVPG